MSGFLAIIILTILSAAYLLYRAHQRPQTGDAAQKDSENAALISAYRQQLAEHPEQKEELDFRLFHELKARQKVAQTHYGALPLWTYPAMIAAFFMAGYYWYFSSGRAFAAWEKIVMPLQPALTRSQFLGDLEALRQVNPVLYCQALQQQIDHHDRQQLDTLGRCFTAYSDYSAAAEVYARLYLLYPDDDKIAFDYAQTTLFSRPEQPMPADIERILIAQSRNNPVAKILLAASYTQAGKTASAQTLWAELRQEIKPDNPLFRLLPPALAPTETNTENKANIVNKPTENANSTAQPVATTPIQITIAPELLRDLPPPARLFVIAARAGERRPLAVKALPPLATQTIALQDLSSMTGETLPQNEALTFRAILSAAGNVSGERVAEAETTTDSSGIIKLHLSP